MLNRILVLLLLAATIVAAQNPRADLARLNRDLNQVRQQARRDRPAALAAARRVLAARQVIIAELEDGDALELTLPPGQARALARLFPELASEIDQRGTLVGVLEVEIEDSEDGTAREFRNLRVGSRRYKTKIRGNPGSVYRVDGVMVGEAMVAESSSLEADAPGACSTTGNQRIAILKVQPPGSNITTPNEPFADAMFAEDASLNGFWKENSAGQTWATGDVYPSDGSWYTLDREYTCSESSALRSAALAAANSDVDFNDYQRVAIYFPKPAGCSFAGRASIGCWVPNPDGGSSISYSLQNNMHARNRTSKVQLSAHELGHNLGLSHASSLDFGAEPLGDVTASGSRSEYGDRYAAEGLWTSGHYAGEHKNQLGWMTPLTITESGTFQLAPFENATGTRLLKVKRGDAQWLWLEYRRRLGAYNAGPTGTNGFDGALVRLGNPNRHSLLLDMTGTQGFTRAALVSGQSWHDPYTDLSISIGPATDDSLAVVVSYGSVPCVAAPHDLSINPASRTVNLGDAAVFNVTLENKDTGPCGDSSFVLSGDLGSTITLSPDSSRSVPLTLTPLVSRGVTVSATRGGQVATASAQVVVQQPPCVPAPPTLSVSPSNWESEFPSPASFSIAVTNNDSATCDPSVFSLDADSVGLGLTPLGTLTLDPGASDSASITATPMSVGTHTLAATVRGVTASATFTSTAPACVPTWELTAAEETESGWNLSLSVTSCD